MVFQDVLLHALLLSIRHDAAQEISDQSKGRHKAERVFLRVLNFHVVDIIRHDDSSQPTESESESAAKGSDRSGKHFRVVSNQPRKENCVEEFNDNHQSNHNEQLCTDLVVLIC